MTRKKRREQSAPPSAEPPPASVAPPSLQRSPLISILLLLLLVAAAFAPAWHAGIIWDDSEHVFENPHVTRGDFTGLWTSHAAKHNYYPLASTIYLLLHRLAGDAPWIYHGANILLHAACVLLLYALLRRLAVPAALFAAALFAIHPLAVDTVAWISQLKTLLATAFALASAYTFVLYLEASPRRLLFALASVILFAAAMFTKATVVGVPLALLLLAYWRDPAAWRRALAPILPMLLIGALLAAYFIRIEIDVGGAGETLQLPLWQRLFIAAPAWWFYLVKWFAPWPLMPVYPLWPVASPPWWSIAALAALAALAAALIAGILLWKRSPIARPALLLLAIYTLLIAPALGLVSHAGFSFSYVSDHYAYTALTALAVFAALLLWHALARRAALRPAIATVVLLALLPLTYLHTTRYQSPRSLWAHTYRYNPDSAVVLNGLAFAHLQDGDHTTAADLYRRALALNPRHARALAGLGNAEFSAGRPADAVAHYRAAIALEPDHPLTWFNLGRALSQLGDHPAALDALARARTGYENDPAYWNDVAAAMIRTGQFPQALAATDRSLALNPAYFNALVNRAMLLVRLERWPDAVAAWERVVAADPRFAQGHMYLAISQVEAGRPSDAIATCRRAISQGHDTPQIRQVLDHATQAASKSPNPPPPAP